jgi:hypothetical protein
MTIPASDSGKYRQIQEEVKAGGVIDSRALARKLEVEGEIGGLPFADGRLCPSPYIVRRLAAWARRIQRSSLTLLKEFYAFAKAGSFVRGLCEDPGRVHQTFSSRLSPRRLSAPTFHQVDRCREEHAVAHNWFISWASQGKPYESLLYIIFLCSNVRPCNSRRR